MRIAWSANSEDSKHMNARQLGRRHGFASYILHRIELFFNSMKTLDRPANTFCNDTFIANCCSKGSPSGIIDMQWAYDNYMGWQVEEFLVPER